MKQVSASATGNAAATGYATVIRNGERVHYLLSTEKPPLWNVKAWLWFRRTLKSYLHEIPESEALFANSKKGWKRVR